MDRRLELQTILEDILGSRNVYFQPPESIKLVYPCIIYSRIPGTSTFAGDQPYTYLPRYEITAIHKDPDSLLPEKLVMLPKCRFERHFRKENLNHDVFNIYY